MDSTRILVTGCAGFIGFHLCEALASLGISVTGIDSLTSYYSPSVKRRRVEILLQHQAFDFVLRDVTHPTAAVIIEQTRPDVVVHLSAQPGVRASRVNPMLTCDENVNSTVAVLEACARARPRHVLVASSSSVYGRAVRTPSREDDDVGRPWSVYAASKRATELLAYTYSHQYRLPITCLRFFTVYGPWGRPDMAIWKFAHALLAGNQIELHGHDAGTMSRSYTFVLDVVSAMVRLFDLPPVRDQDAAYRVLNIGGDPSCSATARDVASTLAEHLGVREYSIRDTPQQPGDVPATAADLSALRSLIGNFHTTPLAAGLGNFAAWFRRNWDFLRGVAHA